MKKSPRVLWLFWFSLALAFVRCTYDRTVTVPKDVNTLNRYQELKHNWTITDGNNKNWEIQNVRVLRDSIFGTLQPAGDTFTDHPRNRVYRRNKAAFSRSFVHIYTSDKNLPKKIRIPIVSLTSIVSHDEAKGRNALIITGVSVIGTGLAIYGIAELVDYLTD